ncbi:unnamed protein product [Sphagnum troendelagicum]
MMMETMRKEVEEEEEDDETPEEEMMMMMRDDRIHDAEDLCGTFDYASLETDIQAQRMVALEESRLDAAIEELLKLENQMRRAADVSRTRRVVMAIVQLCYEARAWKTLNDQIHILSQRQPQLQQVVKAMVQQAAQYIDDAPDMDTRNELIETLNSVSSGKGLKKICWYVVLHPDDNLQSDPTKSNPVEMLKLADPPRACEPPIQQQLLEVQECKEQLQEQSQKQKYEKCNGQFQDQSLETKLDVPTISESRPNTPPPTQQQETKAKEIPRLSSKKSATTSTTRRTTPRMARRRRRRLFDSPSPAEMEDFFSEFEERERKRFTDRYNFDPLKGIPLPGRFDWVSVQSQSTTPTSSSIRRSSTV